MGMNVIMFCLVVLEHDRLPAGRVACDWRMRPITRNWPTQELARAPDPRQRLLIARALEEPLRGMNKVISLARDVQRLQGLHSGTPI